MIAGRFLVFVLLAVQLWFAGEAAAQADRAANAVVSPPNKAIYKLTEALKLKTVSAVDTQQTDYTAFLWLHALLERSFPLVHQHLHKEVVNQYSLLFTWPGTATTQKPLLLSAHLDVVPVEDASREEWLHDPFGGIQADGYIWGRGSMDDKYRVIAILEAVEQLLERGFSPARTVLLAFGHDEESGGRAGAGEIRKLLDNKGIQLEAVFDEGLAVTERLLPGMDGPVAFIGIASKGNLNIQLSVNGDGGHSSVPPTVTPIVTLSEAIYSINKHSFRARITPLTRLTLRTLRHEMSGFYQIGISLYPFTKGIIRRRLASNQATDALIRTKVVPTIIQAGDKYNVLPRSATAVLNVRILTGETAESVLEHLKKSINDERVALSVYGVYTPPSPVTATDTWLYKIMEATILAVFPGAVVAPALFPGTTDALHYADIAENVFLFAPQVVTPENATLIHNVNERLSVDVFERSITFYIKLLEQVSGHNE